DHHQADSVEVRLLLLKELEAAMDLLLAIAVDHQTPPEDEETLPVDPAHLRADQEDLRADLADLHLR
ncbi:Hypothetical protein FKW44_022319, partial [Caligus rogercresseyi]